MTEQRDNPARLPSHHLAAGDPLWVPLLTHYRDDGTVDHDRMEWHITSIHSSVRQIMLAGSTGDGWELDDARFDSLIDFAAARLPGGTKVMFGVLRSDTDAVLARLSHLEERIAALPELAARYAGATICPPVTAEIDQGGIRAHYRRILAASKSPIAVYQLPQVTHCRIAPETLAALAAEPRVVMFKDSSGEDAVAISGRDFGRITLLRGAEGRYVEAVTGSGGYHGWLLSSANVFPADLRRLETLLREGRQADAIGISRVVTDQVEQLFALAGSEGGANAFSNANRAGDHLRAYGPGWPEAPLPLKQDGSRLSRSLVEGAARALGLVLATGAGYLED